MKKHYRLALDVAHFVIDSQPIVEIGIPARIVSEWCAALCLLENGLVETLIIEAPSDAYSLTIQMSDPGRTAARSDVELEGRHVRLNLVKANLDYILSVCLRFFRDGVAEVDHIDVEIDVAGTSESGYLTVRFSEYMGSP